MDLSVIIVSWNTRGLLLDALRSVHRNAPELQMEVFVVDNASADGSADAVEAVFPEVRLIRNSSNRGFAAANNQALGQATGRYILLLNSDTIVLRDVLAASVAYLDNHPRVGVLGCRVLNADRSVQLTCSMYPSLLNVLLKTSGLFRLRTPGFFGREQIANWARDTERDVDVVSGCYLMARREAISQIGNLDEAFYFFGEDTDWCVRFRKAGWGVRFAPVGEIVHYGSASARQRNHHRDVMLTSAIVRLHRTHNGMASAAVVWLLLMVFNISRLAYWTLAVPLRGERARSRMRHFLRVVLDTGQTWPKRA